MGTPDRSLDQRLDALKRANTIRAFRAGLKQELKARKVIVEDLLIEPPEQVQSMKLYDLLMAVPQFGRVKINKLLTACRISPAKTIGGMSQRQRIELVSVMRRWPRV